MLLGLGFHCAWRPGRIGHSRGRFGCHSRRDGWGIDRPSGGGDVPNDHDAGRWPVLLFVSGLGRRTSRMVRRAAIENDFPPRQN